MGWYGILENIVNVVKDRVDKNNNEMENYKQRVYKQKERYEDIEDKSLLKLYHDEQDSVKKIAIGLTLKERGYGNKKDQ